VQSLIAFGPPNIPRLAELHIDTAAIGFTVLISIVAGLIAGVLPTFHVVRANSFASLRENGRTGTGKARHRLRGTIAGLQIALALVVVAGSGLLLRTFQQLRKERPGFDAANVATLWMQLPFARYRDSDAVRFYASLAERVRQVPGVQAVGLTSRLPLADGTSNQRSFSADGGVSSRAQQASLQLYTIDDGYFGAMRIPLVAGRTFDRVDAPRELDVIVSRQASEDLWGDASGRAALGKRLRLDAGGPAYTVIGVADDVRDRALSSPPLPTVYFPETATADTVLGQRPQHMMALVVRTAGQPDAITRSVKRIVYQLDPTVPTFGVQSMSDVLQASTARLSMTLVLVGAAAVITLVLGAIGLYGVTAYVVALRRRELGLRIALGAEPNQIVMMMTQQGLSLALLGVAAGVLIFAAVARFLRSFLYGVAPSDPVTLLAAVVMLLAIAALASWLPARRVAAIDPADALRAE
jgi:putative ABC transport system permease protein